MDVVAGRLGNHALAPILIKVTPRRDTQEWKHLFQLSMVGKRFAGASQMPEQRLVSRRSGGGQVGNIMQN